MIKLITLSLIVGSASLLSACQSNNNQTTTTLKPANKALSTFARFVPERKDDFAWENDLVAFRMYGPAARSGAENAGVDCWLKRVKTPIINKWYKQELQEGKSYHKDWGEGLDNYHVGDSAGCGSSALWLDGQRQPLETYVNWEIIESSQDNTSFALSYEHTINNVVYKERKVIEIALGSRLFKATSTFWANGKLATNLPISVGLTTHDEKAKATWNKKTGVVAAWENLDGFGLGTGVLVNPKKIIDVRLIPSEGLKDKGHVLAIINTDHQGQIEYYAGYGWEKAKEITTVAQWQKYLTIFAKNKATFMK